MSNRTGKPTGALSQEDLQPIMAFQGRTADFAFAVMGLKFGKRSNRIALPLKKAEKID